MSESRFEREVSMDPGNGSDETDSSVGTITAEDGQFTKSGYEVDQKNPYRDQRAQGNGFYSEINQRAQGAPNNFSMQRFEAETHLYQQFTVEGSTARAPTHADDAQAPIASNRTVTRSVDDESAKSGNGGRKKREKHKSGNEGKVREKDGKNRRQKSSGEKRSDGKGERKKGEDHKKN